MSRKDTMGTGEKKSFCPDDGIYLPVSLYQTTNVVGGCEQEFRQVKQTLQAKNYSASENFALFEVG
ncbi:hypothetical protein [Chryseolinea sp. H1M3-3]|uniref:hypothetical protein n=1 Tax=Chryseolinea sp. H1M3-3 TaxID=3034144 RepID=UPI0023EBB694|nr:hypothetical protein [Chryseolinea sp. H1M3-3]